MARKALIEKAKKPRSFPQELILVVTTVEEEERFITNLAFVGYAFEAWR